jgi:tropomyosin
VNETLQRRLQLLEEEAEEADKNLRETNERYVNKAVTKSIRANMLQTPRD